MAAARGVVAVLCLAGVSRAEAHTTPAVLGVVSVVGGEVRAVRLAHGLATLDEQGRWRYLCPHIWQGPDAPLALGLEGGAIVAVGAAAAFEISLEGDGQVRPAPGLNTSTARRLVRAGGAVYALAGVPGESIVARFRPGLVGTVLVDSGTSLHSVVGAEDHFWVAAPASPAAEAIALRSFDLDGAPAGERVVQAASLAGATITLQRAGGELYALLAGSQRETALLRLARESSAAEQVLTSTAVLLGPVDAGRASMIVVDGALAELGARGFSVRDGSRRYTCLDSVDGDAYACTRTQLFALDESGNPGAVVFELGAVVGPRLAQLVRLEEAARAACEIEWLDFATEAGLDPAIPTDDDVRSANENAGCSCSGARGRGGSAILTAMIIFVVSARPIYEHFRRQRRPVSRRRQPGLVL